MASNLPTPRSRELGSVLRKAAEAKGMSTRALGGLLGRNASHISRFFQGKLIPSEAETGAICVHLGIEGEALDALLQVRAEAADPNWLTGLNRQLALLTEYEAAATIIFNAQAQRIPGMLQTREYAACLMASAGDSPEQIESGVAFRMHRQAKLFASNTEFHAIVNEHALRYPECDNETMIEQLRFLLEVAKKPQITVQIVPLTARYTPLRDGSFVFIEGVDPGSEVVYLEHYATSSTLTADQYIREYKGAAERLRCEAMSHEDSLGLIADLIEEMESGDDR